MRKFPIGLLVVLHLLAAAARAQTVPLRTFDKPLWTSADGFSGTPSVRELGDGRLIVVDRRDKEVFLLSPTGVRLRSIGRQGAGPGEYRWPILALSLPGDSTVIVDRELRRLLVIDPTGRPSAISTPPAGATMIDLEAVADAQGRVAFPATWHGTAKDPTVPVLRWHRGTGHVDTIGRMLMREVVMTGNDSMTRTSVAQYSPYDVLAPSREGVLVVRGVDYRVEQLLEPTSPRLVARVPYPPVPVSADERRSELARGVQAPSHKPAVNDVVTSGDGTLWVQRQAAQNAKASEWDVLNPSGSRVARILLPATKRIVAVSKTRVYIARIDEDGLNWLEAYAR